MHIDDTTDKVPGFHTFHQEKLDQREIDPSNMDKFVGMKSPILTDNGRFFPTKRREPRQSMLGAIYCQLIILIMLLFANKSVQGGLACLPAS